MVVVDVALAPDTTRGWWGAQAQLSHSLNTVSTASCTVLFNDNERTAFGICLTPCLVEYRIPFAISKSLRSLEGERD